MKLVTTGGKARPFSWSYSKLKNYETCGKRYFNIDIAKKYKEEESEELAYGNQLHKVLAAAISGKAPLPPGYTKFQTYVDQICGVTNGSSQILVEQQMAITSEFTATKWFGDDAWFRGIADVIKINGPVAAAVDWKTGKIVEDGIQLALIAQCVFAHYPQVQKIRTEFVWLKYEAKTRADFTRADMVSVWGGLLPRVHTLENAHKANEFPPKPGGLCARYCVVTSCPHHGG
jgi:PD-(D/E)XK nuclease superfamily